MANKNKIFIHDSVHDPAHQRGVDRCLSTYGSALADAFPERTIFYSNRKPNFPIQKQYSNVSRFLRDPFPRRISSYLDSIYCTYLADTQSVVYYSPYYGKVKTRIPQVFSAHDMIYEKFRSYFPSYGVEDFIQEKKECFKRSSLILCVSESTASDILNFYPEIPEVKIKIVYNGVDLSFFDSVSDHYSGKPYFLYVGNRDIYKNFIRLLTAFGKSGLAKEFDLRVITPSNNFPTDEEKSLINEYHLANNVIVEVAVSEETLKKRYQQAFAFIFPSEYEGFGLPLIEAMASGTLVLSSNTSSLPEIGSTVPLYFNPDSVDSIINILFEASQLPEESRQNRIKAGYIQANKFLWKHSQEKFIESIKSVL